MEQAIHICQNCRQEFFIVVEDFSFYEKIGVPAPTFCPDCRLVRRLAFREERALYKDTCDLCGVDMVSLYAPGTPCPVYCSSCWWSDNWDATSYGLEYDFSKPFFLDGCRGFQEAKRKAQAAYCLSFSPLLPLAGRAEAICTFRIPNRI